MLSVRSAQETVTGIPIQRIDAALSPAYSRNLHRWLVEHVTGASLPTFVYRVLDDTPLSSRFGVGELMVGRPYQDPPGSADFSGARVSLVLCEGEKAEPMRYPNMTTGTAGRDLTIRKRTGTRLTESDWLAGYLKGLDVKLHPGIQSTGSSSSTNDQLTLEFHS